jgi:hypothetical protein
MIDLDALEAAVHNAIAGAFAKFRTPPAQEPFARTFTFPRPHRPQEILDWVRRNPGRTALEITHGVFGPHAIQPDAQGYLLRLLKDGKIIRDDRRPARYWVKDAKSAA